MLYELMTIASLIANALLLIAYLLQLRQTRYYFNRWAGAMLELNHWREHGLMRNPKTGRYMKKEPNQ